MAVTLSVELTDEQYAALAHIAVDPQDWFQGMVRLRAKNTIAEIANAKIKEMIADPAVSSIPASKDEIFAQELAAGHIKSAAQMNEEEAAAMLETIATAGDLIPQTPALDSDNIDI
jgi:hypothetical protein